MCQKLNPQFSSSLESKILGLDSLSIPSSIVHHNVRKSLDEAEAFTAKWNKDLAKKGELFDVTNRYATNDEIVTWLRGKAANHSSNANLINMGQTYESRDMWVMQITDNSPGKQGVWIDCGIHAREWITPPTCNYIIAQLLDGLQSGNQAIVNLVQKFDWYILSVANPDGFVYTHTDDRFWRKTRSPTPDFDIFWEPCTGTDPNRNFDHFWLDESNQGSSDYGCDEDYRGESAFSERCTANIRDFTVGRNFQIFFSLHSFGQMWLVPYSHDYDARPPNAAELDRAGLVGLEALEARHGSDYSFGTVPELMYLGNGGSMDWARSQANIPYTYGMETRPDSDFGGGFDPPESEIRPNSEEVWDGIQATANTV